MGYNLATFYPLLLMSTLTNVGVVSDFSKEVSLQRALARSACRC